MTDKTKTLDDVSDSILETRQYCQISKRMLEWARDGIDQEIKIFETRIEQLNAASRQVGSAKRHITVRSKLRNKKRV